MRWERWLDHLTPWISFGALAWSGVYEPGEVAGMAAPLVAAALTELARLDLGRWRRLLELATLAFILLDALRRPGLVPVVVHTLFLLCGVRLMLPREGSHRRQVLLMAFLLFLTTSITTTDLGFLAWGMAWVMAAAALLMQLAWEGSAQYRRGPGQPPPFRRILPWSLAALALGGAAFFLMPRITLGIRPISWRLPGLAVGQAGFSDRLELGGGGPIQHNPDVVLRVVPPPNLSPSDFAAVPTRFGLLRALPLGVYSHGRWESAAGAEGREIWPFPVEAPRPRGPGELELEFFVSPTPSGILPLPYGPLRIIHPTGVPVHQAGNGSVRWNLANAANLSLRVAQISAAPALPLPAPSEAARPSLTFTGEDEDLARRWSEALAPGDLAPEDLAARLSAELRGRFRYTLDNPSGKAPNPIEDFLERSHAGHCEYFASAAALMLRARGVPARIANGYRLGPWSPEGGYWLVTQDQAHSWVEYYDRKRAAWRVLDPTPPAPPQGPSGAVMAALSRWTDALRFRWDRHVVRYSGEDQLAGFAWLNERLARLSNLGLPSFSFLDSLQGALMAAAAAWLLFRTRGWWRPRLRRWGSPPSSGLAALRPLLKRAEGAAPPRPGETARAWLHRLAEARPERRQALWDLADAVDGVIYGGGAEAPLRERVRIEAKQWS